MLNNLLLGQTEEEKLYVEDVFSTYLYTGTGSTQTITNGIDLAGKGGMVWIKSRTKGSAYHRLQTQEGSGYRSLYSNSTSSGMALTSSSFAFTSSGFTNFVGGDFNASGENFASWTFRKAPKFFDVVTYTGNGVAGRAINHSLGIAPGMIIVKRTNAAGEWPVYHRSLSNPVRNYVVLNTTASASSDATYWNDTSPTSTAFFLGDSTTTNANGGSYVAYLFAHDTTSDGVIQCGSYTGNGNASGPTISLGWEPQYVMIKMSSSTGDWQIFDNMRGIPTGAADPYLFANTSGAEATTNGDLIDLTPTGFAIKSTNAQVNTNNETYIYLAIRRGPMRTPTDATKVLSVKTYSATTSSASVTHDVVIDLEINKNRDVSNSAPYLWVDRLRGLGGVHLQSSATGAEIAYPTYWSPRNQTEMYAPSGFDAWWSSSSGTNSHSSIAFRRAPGFFDVTCYSGTGVARTVSHNLGVAPELMIVKVRNATNNWSTYISSVGPTKVSYLNLTGVPLTDSSVWNNTNPTSTAFTVNTASEVNGSGNTYVAYLFASCPGVSKVGTYTGNGSSQNIDCGFTNGARFVLIKRTNSTGDWYVWDTARGIVSANDPHLSLNTTAAEVTTNDSIDPLSTGFTVNQNATTNINVSGGTYIYLAIA